jgi:hypothetical protein
VGMSSGEVRLVASSKAAPDPFVSGSGCWCLSCGCTDRHACAAGCRWLWSDVVVGVGLCSSCEEWLDVYPPAAALSRVRG